MHAKGSNLGNTRRKIAGNSSSHAKCCNLRNTHRQIAGNASSLVSNLPQNIGFDSSHEVALFSDWRKDPRISCCRHSIRNKIFEEFSSYIQQEQAYNLANFVEDKLCIEAASQEEYMNQDTLSQRLEIQLDKLIATNRSQQVDRSLSNTSTMVPSSGSLHAWSNGIMQQPAVQEVAGLFSNATDFCAVPVDNKYGFPNGELCHSFMNHEPVFSPETCSSISTCTNMDVLSNFYDSGGGRNLEANSKSNSSYFPQQQPGKLDMIKYGDCSGTVQKTDSMAFMTTMGQSLQSQSSNLLTCQHFSRKYSEVSHPSHGLRSLGDIRHYQPQNLVFQQNLEHSVEPRVLHGKTHMAQPNSYFFNQGDHCRHILGQKTLNQPQLSSLGLGGSATMNSRSSSQVLLEESILLEYFMLKEFNIVSQDDVVKYLHSTVCSEGICNCAQNIILLMHFDACQGDNCSTCCSWKSRALENHLEISKSIITNSVVRKNKAPSGDSDAKLLSPNRRKLEMAFGVSLINDARSDQLSHKMVQPCYPEAPPKRRKVESDFGVSLINKASSDQLTHSMVQPCYPEAPPKRRKVESHFGASLINNASSDQFTHKVVQLSYPEALSELKQQQESLPSSEVTECNVELCTNPMVDLMSNGKTKNNVVDETFGQILKNETVLSKGSEADHISGEPDSKSHDEEASRNSEQTAIGLNYIVDNTLCKRRKVESDFCVSLINNASSNQFTHKVVQLSYPEALSELKQQQESLPSSEVTECNVELCTNPMVDLMSNGKTKNNVVDDTFGQILKNETVLSKGSEADHISGEPDSKSHNEEASRNSEQTAIGLNSIVDNTLCKESMAADIEEPDSKSNEVNANSNSIETGVILNSCMNTLGKEPMAADIEEPDSESNEVNANSNSIETGVILNSYVNTLGKEPMAADIEEPDSKSNDVNSNSNFVETGIILNSDMNTLCKEPTPADIEDIQGRTGFNHDVKDATKKVIERKADQEKETKPPNQTVNTVSFTDFFTSNQIREHIKSLRKQFNQSTTVEEPGNDIYKCQLCAMGTLSFAPEPIYCLCCGNRIKRNTYYYYKRDGDDTQNCFCSRCYRISRRGNISFNGTSVSKSVLDKKTNNKEFEEAWVECNKCKSWQHSVCALYNYKRDLDNSAMYTCPLCRLKEIGSGMHAPLPKSSPFDAKDLPKTMLSDHIERRLFKRLMQESKDWENVEGNKNLDEVLVAENLSVREVLSVNKQLKVKKEFLDIFSEGNYPAEFSYTSKVILLFQQIEGVDVCLFGMYVQEFGPECGCPNQRSVYISYLDSVKYFRPERQTVRGEALRTFVYHEILIGYLDFCKKRGFTTCYIWACPPMKGEDYILYCHPDTQKTPKKDKLRHWYHSMLSKAAEENIVVGLTNVYDHFFVPTGHRDSKVTAARLPYFDGDFWSGCAMDKARIIEQESGGEYEGLLKKLLTKRTLKTMGHIDSPSKGTAKDILVMQKLGQTILPVKEDFIVVQFQYVCMHCHEVIESGKRWFCTKCKQVQECERCHTTGSHTSHNGEKHTLCQVLMKDIRGITQKNITLDNALFNTRHNFLSYCQRNMFQFDSLRRAKYSSMMILSLLHNPNLLNVETICRVCCKNVNHCCWKCDNCPEFTVCSACYNERGANCHAHTLVQTYSTAQSPSGNQELTQNSALIKELQDVIKHAWQCHSTKTQPCTYPNCLSIKKLFAHASKCTIRVSGGCLLCKKAWMGLAVHSRDCRDAGCRIPRCMDLKKQAEERAEWIAAQSESLRRAAVFEGCS